MLIQNASGGAIILSVTVKYLLKKTKKQNTFVHSFTLFEGLNIGIHEYLGQSLTIPENSQLSHFFNVFFLPTDALGYYNK